MKTLKHQRILTLTAVFLLGILLLTGCAGGSAPAQSEPQPVISLPSSDAPVIAESSQQSDPSAPEREAYTFAWISDTQIYSASYPDIFTEMTAWVADNSASLGIRALFHTGDVVDSRSKPQQWINARSAMSLLDGKLPYTVLAGNHDVGANAGDYDYSQFLADYGESSPCGAQTSMLWYKGGESRALLLDIGSKGYIILAIGWGADDAAFAWANSVLAEHRDRIAVLTTHSYLHIDATVGSNGMLLFDDIVKTNPNVKLVLCGHNHSAARVAAEIDDNGDGTPDRRVWQLLADYQAETNGGNGFIRLLQIDENSGLLSVKTYSPHTDSYNCLDESEDEFTLDISDWFV